MLSIYFGDMPQAIYNTAVYFKNTYEDDWITDELSREMIREYYEDGEESGISLSCEKECIVLAGRDWENVLAAKKDCIVFIDEGNRFVHTKEFAGIIQKTDNYYVIVTREGLVNLPYSVEEIYGIRESGKYASIKQVYHEFYRLLNG